jgi:MinD superfamily P-loop ATPase
MSDQIAEYCASKNIGFVGRIPYDTAVTYAMVASQSIVEFSDGHVSKAIREIWHTVEDFLKDNA